jgi:hypothetical protein
MRNRIRLGEGDDFAVLVAPHWLVAAQKTWRARATTGSDRPPARAQWVPLDGVIPRWAERPPSFRFARDSMSIHSSRRDGDKGLTLLV